MEDQTAGLVMLLFSVVLVAVLCIVTTRQGAEGTLDRNGSVGIRTRHTQASDEAWRAGHAAAVPGVNRSGWVAAATVPLAVSAHVSWGGSWGNLAGLCGMLIQVTLLLFATRVANRAAQAAS